MATTRRLGHLPPPKFSKHCIAILTFLQKLSKNKDEILYSNHFKEKSYLNFSLYYWLIISLQDLCWDRLFNRKFRKWLVFQPKIRWNCQNVGDSLKCWYFYSETFFILLLVYDFFWGSCQFALMKLYNIMALLNCANCWNFRSDKRNLDMLVVIRRFCGHVKPLVLLRPFD